MTNKNLNKQFHWGVMMIFVTIFQLLTSTVTIVKDGINVRLLWIFIAYIAVEWIYFIIASAFCGQNNFELETIGFTFSGIGLTVCASVYDDYAVKQMLSTLLGLVLFVVMLCVLRRTDVVMFLRMPVAAAALGLLAVNIAFAQYNNGALNWISFKGLSIQPSEIVKLAFIFVGAASLDKLQSTRSLTKYLIFSFVCVGALFYMRDFGTALIFFFTFIVIAFMRSGDVRTIGLVCVVAALGALMVLFFSSTVAARFSTYRHIWDDMNGKGMQQTRVLIYSVSGGLFGLGIGEGKLKDVFASTTDLVFGMICEEWGLIVAFTIVLTYVFILIYAIKVARTTRSAFYAIAACAAAGLLLFQTGLNIFGVTDIVPLTGVTLPFISRGGTSIVCSWGLLAFIKSADIRTYPKLSETILPDYPLYPPDIRIGRYTSRRPVSIPSVPNSGRSSQGKSKATPQKPISTASVTKCSTPNQKVSEEEPDSFSISKFLQKILSKTETNDKPDTGQKPDTNTSKETTAGKKTITGKKTTTGKKTATGKKTGTKTVSAASKGKAPAKRSTPVKKSSSAGGKSR